MQGVHADRTNLRSEQGKARSHSSLENPEKEANCDSAGERLCSGHATQHQTPHDDAEGRVFGERKALEEAIRRVFPSEVSCCWSTD